MAYPFKKRKYDQLKHERYVLVAFKDGKRIITYGGLSADAALEYVQFYSRKSPYITVLVFNEKELVDPATGRVDTCTAWEQSYYEKFSNKEYQEARMGLDVV